MISNKTYDLFLATLAEIVNEDRPFKEKKAALMEKMCDVDVSNLEELVAWTIDG